MKNIQILFSNFWDLVSFRLLVIKYAFGQTLLHSKKVQMIKSLCEMKPFLCYYSNEVNRNIEYYYMLSSGMEGFRFDIGKLKISSKIDFSVFCRMLLLSSCCQTWVRRPLGHTKRTTRLCKSISDFCLILNFGKTFCF